LRYLFIYKILIMKYLIFATAFFFTFTLAFGQSKGDKKLLDSLTKAYNAPNLSKDDKWQRCLDLGVYYRDRQMFNKAQSIFQEALNGTNEDWQKIETLRKIAYAYTLNNNNIDASKSVIEGIEILPNIKIDSIRLYYYDRLLRNYPTDNAAYYESYTKISKDFYNDAFVSKNWFFLYRAVANLSRFYCAIGENSTAFDTLNNAISLFKKTNASKSEIECYYQLSNAYFSKKQYKDGIKALYLYEKSIEENRCKFKNQNLIIHIWESLIPC
jgi:tetratricopeptide (TPR) repeat protein